MWVGLFTDVLREGGTYVCVCAYVGACVGGGVFVDMWMGLRTYFVKAEHVESIGSVREANDADGGVYMIMYT
jgi:hypothetical protein